jgi:protein-S-isoprenylcysteine O-methyltransferase Ste14
MVDGTGSRRRRLDRGTWLVAAQFVCLGVIWLWPAPPLWVLPAWVVVACWSVIVAALLLGLWGAGALGRFLRVHPRPADRAELRTGGAYRVVRHPIYAAVLLGSVAGTVLAARPEPVIGLAALSLVLHMKASYEEGLLRERFGEAYDTYASRVPRLVPFVHV